MKGEKVNTLKDAATITKCVRHLSSCLEINILIVYPCLGCASNALLKEMNTNLKA